MKTGEDESVPDPQAIDKVPARRIALTLAATLPPIVLSVIAEVRGAGLSILLVETELFFAVVLSLFFSLRIRCFFLVWTLLKGTYGPFIA
jgi:hypothetical protein